MTMRGDRRAWYRALLVAVLTILAGVTFFSLRGPDAWQRRYYPLHHERAIAESAIRHEVNPFLVASVINAESAWRADAVSGAGAKGLMQLLPSTAEELARRGLVDAERFPPDELLSPEVNIEYGTAYLRYLVERYHEIEVALAAYNAGLVNADRWADEGGDIRDRIDFPETRHFVLKVARGRDKYKRLYPDAFAEWRNRP